MRTIKTENKKILLNGRQIALRGTTDCAIYPLTGYPPTDLETWRRNLSVIKSYGMNHVRFHAWCPPENAFNAADELGIYVSVEMPLWLNRDVCALELGEDSIHRAHFLNAALNISRTFGNHPSFIMFSNGNENMGDFELLNDITTCVKAYDSRRIYTLTSNFDHPVLPCEDYLCAYEAGGHPIRIQNIQDEAAKDTCLDYSQAVSDVPVPIISFEVGQYCVYPDVDSLDKFSGCMMPVNFAAIRKDMQEKGVYDRLADYIKASGDLAVKLYKEDIEAALRTKDFGGIELLSLCDYTGQSTATIGILDVFMDSKGLITPEKFREFCNAVVPLFKAKRIFTNRETFEAELDLYDFGDTKMTVPQYHVTIRLHGRIFYETTTRDTKISVPLDTIDRSSQLDVTVEVGEYRNSWRIFVFAENTENYDVKYIRTPQELEEIKRTGGRAIVTKDCFENAIDGSFIPVFWSPVHFPSPRPCGSIIDETHPALAKFPTGRYPDYQWKRLLDHSVSMDISKIDGAQPIVETVPNFFNNVYSSSLFEVKAGNAELLFCGFDLDGDYPESRALKASIEKYCSA